MEFCMKIYFHDKKTNSKHLFFPLMQAREDILFIYFLTLARAKRLSSEVVDRTSPGILAHLYGQRRYNCKSFNSSTAHIYDVPITTY